MEKMFNPPHPAAILREDVLPAPGLTVTEAARQFGDSRVALSRVLNERAGISVDLARRIEAWLGPETAAALKRGYGYRSITTCGRSINRTRCKK